MKTYLTLFDDTFLWFNEQQGVLYNTKRNKVFEFIMTSPVYKYCQLLNDCSNLYTLEIPNNILEESDDANETKHWLTQVQNGFGLINKNVSYKPICIPPLLNVRSLVSQNKSMSNEFIKSVNPMENLSELTLFIGGETIPLKYTKYHRQVLYPISSLKSMDIGGICHFFNINNMSFLRQLNIVGTNLQDLLASKIVEYLYKRYNLRVDFYMRAEKSYACLESISKIDLNKFNVSIYFENISTFNYIIQHSKECNKNFKWLFLVTNRAEYFKYSQLIKRYKLEKFELLPIVNRNAFFIKNSMRIQKQDFVCRLISKREIFCNSIINSNYWGHLYILPDMSIKSNLCKSKIGTTDEQLVNILKTESFDEKSSWKEVRSKIEGCTECNYRQLCPPPSKIEYAQNDFQICFKRKY